MGAEEVKSCAYCIHVATKVCEWCNNKDWWCNSNNCWSPKIVTVKERAEKALSAVCDKVDAMEEDVANQSHYTRFKIQPIEFIKANGLGYLEGNVIKYVCRYPYKGTPLKDLYKAKDYIEHLIAKQKEKEGNE